MAIEEVEVVNDFKSNREKENDVIECLVQGEEDEPLNYYVEIPRSKNGEDTSFFGGEEEQEDPFVGDLAENVLS